MKEREGALCRLLLEPREELEFGREYERPGDIERDDPLRWLLPREMLPREMLPRELLPRDMLPRDMLPRWLPPPENPPRCPPPPPPPRLPPPPPRPPRWAKLSTSLTHNIVSRTKNVIDIFFIEFT
ncbi:hypothetical protein [Gimesia chilikensis]|uniref:hypothetical protein n=1 Tax=Gimesia chilikensis TaxID=2605989 RepID=UPI0018D9B301|nr:hypothetical protein [Gimesia chilikensis]